MIRRRPVPLVSRKRAALFGFLLALSTVALVVPLLPFKQDTKPGDIAPRTLVASRDAHYESRAVTDIAREEAARAVPPVPLPIDPAVRQQQQDKLTKLFDQVRLIRASSENLQQRMDQFAALPGAELSNSGRSVLFTLDNAKFDLLQQRAGRALAAILTNSNARPDASTSRIDDYLVLNVPETAAELTALRETLKLFVIPSEIDRDQTKKNQDGARANVQPISKTYSRGQVIVAEGDGINAEAIEALRATGVIDQGFDGYDVAGGVILAMAFGLALATFTYRFQPFPAPAGRRMTLVALSLVGVLAAVRVAIPQVTPDSGHYYLEYALPVAAAAMITAAFADLSFAAIVAVAVGLFAAFIPATLPELAGSSFVGSMQSLELATVYIAGGLAGAFAVHRAERLGRYAAAALATGLATAMVLAVFWLISTPRENVDLGWMALAAAGAGLGSAVISLAAFVLLSMALGVSTRLQLMELSQPGHPLLRRLQDEAPGTYHHSMMVGAIAERAADLIGADAVVARVGAYYHDIGKLARPTHYIENMLDGAHNPHDDMLPEDSARIIREHVTNGLDLARKHHLPPVIRDFIPEHHGTRLVTYFYRRAVNRGESVDAAPFRYTGPRPQTKESAIVMLADSCEAVVRARQNSDRPAIDELVDGVFAERFAEGQLDECDVTIRELHQVAASFKATLRAVYHPRVPYPSPTPEELASVAQGELPLFPA